MRERWTSKEMSYLFTNMTNAEIAKKTGRTENAVYRKRYNVLRDGTITSDIETFRISPGQYMSQTEKEDRLRLLASKLCLKIGGINR